MLHSQLKLRQHEIYLLLYPHTLNLYYLCLPTKIQNEIHVYGITRNSTPESKLVSYIFIIFYDSFFVFFSILIFSMVFSKGTKTERIYPEGKNVISLQLRLPPIYTNTTAINHTITNLHHHHLEKLVHTNFQFVSPSNIHSVHHRAWCQEVVSLLLQKFVFRITCLQFSKK